MPKRKILTGQDDNLPPTKVSKSDELIFTVNTAMGCLGVSMSDYLTWVKACSLVDRNDNTPLQRAIKNDDLENVKILFNPSARDVQFPKNTHGNILHDVAKFNAYKTAKWLFQKLERSSPLWKEKNSYDGMTPYELAIKCNNFKVAMAFADLQRDEVPTLLYLSMCRLSTALPLVDEEANQSELDENNDTVTYFQQIFDLAYIHEKFKQKHRINYYTDQKMIKSEEEKSEPVKRMV